MVIAVFAAGLVGVVVSFFIGVLVAGQSEVKKQVRAAGFTPNAGKLYVRAAKLLKQLVEKHDFEGGFGADTLSPETEKRVKEWLADYRKEINR